jgi:hypothetical protein
VRVCISAKAYLTVRTLSVKYISTARQTIQHPAEIRCNFLVLWKKHNSEHELLYEVRSGVFMLFGWRPAAQSTVKAVTGRMTYFWMCTVDSRRPGPRISVQVHVQLDGPTKSQTCWHPLSARVTTRKQRAVRKRAKKATGQMENVESRSALLQCNRHIYIVSTQKNALVAFRHKEVSACFTEYLFTTHITRITRTSYPSRMQ